MARRPARTAALAAVCLALAGCGAKATPEPRASAPATTQGTTPAPPPTTTPDRTDPGQQKLLRLLVPKGVPTSAKGQPADPADLAVVKRWLAALTRGDIPAAADTFADGAVVQNFQPLEKLPNRAARIAFNEGFPCGAELSTASSVKGYLVVTYRLTDRKDSGCDGPGGSASGTIKVEAGRMTEWYRLPDVPAAGAGDAPGPVV